MELGDQDGDNPSMIEERCGTTSRLKCAPQLGREPSESVAFADVVTADHLPRISVGAITGYTASTLDALGSSGTPRHAVCTVISWPLFDLACVRARSNAAHAGEEKASARYEQTMLAALADVETSITRYTSAREQLVHLEEATAASERATELARLRFTEGATDFPEVLDTVRRQLEAQNRLADVCTEATSSLVSVYQALGGRWDVDAPR